MTDVTMAESIRQEEQLDISIERVEKINSPLLVVGLGGTGKDAVRTIKRIFAERYILPEVDGKPIPVPPRTAYLVFDTDTKDMNGFDTNEFVDISLPGLSAILDPQRRSFNLTQTEQKWVNRHLNSASGGLGAGTYRQAARFMLGRNYDKVYSAISGALNNIASVQMGNAERPSGRVEIVVVTGICGGTGSGTFLDMAQIIRHCMGTEPALNMLDYKITAYLVMPDIMPADLSASSPLVGIFQANGFAALKELDFWMRWKDHETPYEMSYGNHTIPWARQPFDACILMSGTNVDGTVFANAYNVVQKTIAENLLHYMADEMAEVDAEGRAQYTYISYEDNLRAAVTAMDKIRPLFYGYRAIGAYTKRIPKKKVLYYEGSLLFETFMPPRDEQYHLVPNAALSKDGRAHNRAAEIVKKIEDLYNNFKQICVLPPICNADNERLRSMDPLPHDRADAPPNRWRMSAVLPAAERAANDYLEAAWQRFRSFAERVMTDPEYGPYALQHYLDDQSEGLLAALVEVENRWNTNAAGFTNNVGTKYELAKTAWPDFKKPPLLGKGKAEETYRTALNEYYDNVRKSDFMRAYAEAMTKLIKRIREFIRDGLDLLCEDLLRMESEFAQVNNEPSEFSSDIFDVNTIKGRIDDSFRDKNADQTVSRRFLGDMSLAALETQPNVDAHSSGVRFPYRYYGMTAVLQNMRDSLNFCFGEVNGETLDEIMFHTVGDNPTMQQQYMDKLGESVISSARPLFSQDGPSAEEAKTPYSYLSVPDDAKRHIERFNAAFKGRNVEPKGSKLHDHIYCVTAWDGLPLYRYSQMSRLEDAYANALSNPSVSMGLHLVWDGERDSSYTTNWTRLPSPRPYYFFQRHGTPDAEAAYQHCRQVTERARACGMLEVDASRPEMSMKVHVFFGDAYRSVVLPAAALIEAVNGISAAKDPVTGNPILPDAVIARIQAHLQTADTLTTNCPQKPFCLAAAQGLEDQPCDPWDASIAANPQALERARENHQKLSEELATALISGNPRLLAILETQLEGFAYAKKVMDDIDTGKRIWQPRIENAEKVARMMVYNIVFPSMAGWDYNAANGERLSVIQERLLAPDLKNEDSLVQVAGYLGDLQEGNPSLHDMNTMLQEAETGLVESDRNGTLTAAQLTKLQGSVATLRELCDQETKAYKGRRNKMDADTQRIDDILAMLSAIDAKADSEHKKFANLLRVL